MAWMKREDESVKTIESVREKELEYIVRRQPLTSGELPKKEDVSDRLIGLAFSGGGIRSATTNLGIAQALSRMGILRLVDYLSTVSGGGYIGGCLTTFLSVNRNHEQQAGNAAQFNYRSRDDLKFGTGWSSFPFNPDRTIVDDGTRKHAEPSDGTRVVAHLRTHGDFLIARRSILKREALRAVGTLFGGLLYTVLITALALAVAALLLLGAAHALSGDLKNWNGREAALVSTDRYKVESSVADTELRFTRTDTGGTVREATDPGLWDHVKHRVGLVWRDMLDDVTTLEIGAAAMTGVFVSVVVLVLFAVATKVWKGPDKWQAGESKEDAFEVRLLRLAAVLLGLAIVIVPYANATAASAANRGRAAWLLQPFFVAAGAYGSAFLVYGFVIALFGTAGFLWSRVSRSLWGSYLAISLYILIATVLFAVLPAASYAAHAVGLAGMLAPIGTLITGRLLMTRSVTGAAERFELSKSVLHFLLGLVVTALVFFTMIEVGALAIEQQFVDPLNAPAALFGWNRYLLALAVAGGALLILSVFVNLNRIGLHYFYRDRILETYLRSEVARKDLTMKTFMDTMEMRLKDIQGNQVDDKDSPLDPAIATPGNTAPYLLVSAALNLAGSRDLTRKDRKSGYFLFSKYFCGSRQTGYLETQKYSRGMTQLARALTVSGAAAGTGIGYQTYFAQSFLTALFNIRLGQWVPNPRTNSGQRVVFWPNYIIREVFGLTNERTRLVNVSDGGHTGDNLGIYPLLERRCQVIIACDAEADPTIAFGSFTEALRHAYVDLGVDVDIDLSMIRPDPATGLSKAHCAIGRIRYPECPGRPNWLVYMKNTLTGNEPAPVLNYKRSSVAFPHESTADQFFDDAQFESYRALGDHIAEETFGRWILDSDIRTALRVPHMAPSRRQPCATEFPLSNAGLAWDQLLIYHSPFRAADSEEEFHELTSNLGDLDKLVMDTPGLVPYYRECMGLPALEPPPGDKTDPVNFIAMQIQLMEDTYFSLRLDQYANARDNRGWMNLFRRWANSPTFRAYFQQLQTIYSNDFVAFYCNYIEGWKPIDEEPLPHAWDVLHVTEQPRHPVAFKCQDRGAPGLFLDPGRREAHENVPIAAHPLPGQRGTGMTSETTPPTPPAKADQ
jgi:hypothetical protein